MEKITRKVTATVIHYSEAVLENGMPAFRPNWSQMRSIPRRPSLICARSTEQTALSS